MKHKGKWRLYDTELKSLQALDWAFSKLILAVQIEIFSEKVDTGFFLKVYFTKDLEVVDVGNGIGPDILRVKLHEVQHITEEF